MRGTQGLIAPVRGSLTPFPSSMPSSAVCKKREKEVFCGILMIFNKLPWYKNAQCIPDVKVKEHQNPRLIQAEKRISMATRAHILQEGHTTRLQKQSGLNRQLKERITAWMFSAPALLLLLFFLIVPFCMAIYFSLTDQRLLPGPFPTQFVGLQNFIRLLSDDAFHHALINNFLFALVVVPLQAAFALLLGILTNQKIRGIVFFRTIYFMPVVTTMVVIAVIWTFFYSSDHGLVNEFLGAISFGHLGPYQWLNDTHLALPAIMFMSIWQGVGFQMVIFLAGLQNIPEELYEAGKLDGAGNWNRFIHITIPQLRNTFLFVIIATTILSFKLFAQVQIMTQGGPDNATITTVYEIVNQGFSSLHVGYASAMAIVFFVIVLVISLLQRIFIPAER